MLTIRPIELGDVPLVAELHHRCWQAAYADLVPAEALAKMDLTESTARWQRGVIDPPAGRFQLLAEHESKVVAFISYGAYRDDHDPDRRNPGHGGEIYSVYADPRSWGTGAGHALLEAALVHLRELGASPVRLWALDGNERADRFYRRHGFAPDGETMIYDFNGAPLPLSRYALAAGTGGLSDEAGSGA